MYQSCWPASQISSPCRGRPPLARDRFWRHRNTKRGPEVPLGRLPVCRPFLRTWLAISTLAMYQVIISSHPSYIRHRMFRLVSCFRVTSTQQAFQPSVSTHHYLIHVAGSSAQVPRLLQESEPACLKSVNIQVSMADFPCPHIHPGQLQDYKEAFLVNHHENPNNCTCGWYTFFRTCGCVYATKDEKCGARLSRTGKIAFCRSPAPKNLVICLRVMGECALHPQLFAL